MILLILLVPTGTTSLPIQAILNFHSIQHTVENVDCSENSRLLAVYQVELFIVPLGKVHNNITSLPATILRIHLVVPVEPSTSSSYCSTSTTW